MCVDIKLPRDCGGINDYSTCHINSWSLSFSKQSPSLMCSFLYFFGVGVDTCISIRTVMVRSTSFETDLREIVVIPSDLYRWWDAFYRGISCIIIYKDTSTWCIHNMRNNTANSLIVTSCNFRTVGMCNLVSRVYMANLATWFCREMYNYLRATRRTRTNDVR